MIVILGTPFLTVSNADEIFAEKELTWRLCSAAKALPTTKRVQVIDQKEVASMALDPDEEVSVVHVASFPPTIHPTRQAQIVFLNVKEVPDSVPKESLNFADAFSKELAVIVPIRTKIREHALDLEEVGLFDFQSHLLTPILFVWKPEGSLPITKVLISSRSRTSTRYR